ncbi:hypothetical protein FACS1894184_20310 [Clostridia bacterium]|nr:hypothetical protein FACS1894184_20310 [Clostridia bacterium]
MYKTSTVEDETINGAFRKMVDHIVSDSTLISIKLIGVYVDDIRYSYKNNQPVLTRNQ